MTVKELYDMWGELHSKSVVDVHTSGGDILEVNQLFCKVFLKYEYYKVCSFGAASYNQFHKILTIEV